MSTALVQRSNFISLSPIGFETENAKRVHVSRVCPAWIPSAPLGIRNSPSCASAAGSFAAVRDGASASCRNVCFRPRADIDPVLGWTTANPLCVTKSRSTFDQMGERATMRQLQRNNLGWRKSGLPILLKSVVSARNGMSALGGKVHMPLLHVSAFAPKRTLDL